MSYNTKHINLATLLNNEEAVRKLLKLFREVWNNNFEKEKGREMKAGNDSNSLRGLCLDLIWLYSKRINIKIEEKVKRELRAKGKSEDWIRLNLYPRASGEEAEINKDKEFKVRDNELKRITMCNTYLKEGSYESSVPKIFQTTQGKGEDNDLNFYGSDEGEAPKSRDFDKEGDLNFYEGREDSNDKESEDFINDNSYDDRNESDVNEGGGEEHPSPDANERRRRRDFNLRIKKRINYNYGPSPKRRRRNNSVSVLS